MWRTCVSTVFGVTQSRSAMPRSVSPSAIRREHLALALGELASGSALAAARQQLVDELGVDDDLAGGDPLECADELARVR